VDFFCDTEITDICDDGFGAYVDGIDGTHVAESNQNRLRFNFQGRNVIFNICESGECDPQGNKIVQPGHSLQPTFFTGTKEFLLVDNNPQNGIPEDFDEAVDARDPNALGCGEVQYTQGRWFIDIGVKKEKNRISHSIFDCSNTRPVRVTCLDANGASCTLWEVTSVSECIFNHDVRKSLGAKGLTIAVAFLHGMFAVISAHRTEIVENGDLGLFSCPPITGSMALR